jgi:CBS domain-containing protein
MASIIHNVLPIPPRPIVFISPDESVKQCIRLMADFDIGALVVLDERKNLLGMVTERDIVRSCLDQSCNPDKTKALDIVYTKVTILSPHDTVEKAMQVMTDTKRRHILIGENGKFLAILSIGDLLYHLLEDKSRVIEHLEQYIHS